LTHCRQQASAWRRRAARSLRKPRVSDTTPNRALLRGFPAAYFSDFGLCRRSGFFVTIFGALSLHPKIPFPAAGALSAKLDRTAHRNSDFWATVIEILDRRGSYSGLSPSASNCRLHSVGRSRSRSSGNHFW